jgi:phosphatidylethanolamine-binding protein (PEBP) family uncharacterized protein
MGFSFTSPLFASGQAIPFRFARAGGTNLPPLVWSGEPDAMCSFVFWVGHRRA